MSTKGAVRSDCIVCVTRRSTTPPKPIDAAVGAVLSALSVVRVCGLDAVMQGICKEHLASLLEGERVVMETQS